MAFKIKVDEDSCVGCGACAAQYSEFFEMDDNTGKAVPTQMKFDEVDTDVADVCPVGAIEVNKA